MIIDVDECTGCNLCIIACKDEHVGSAQIPWTKPQPDTGHFWINLETYERGSIPKVKMTYLPLLCQHCENAPCMKSCPENAIDRREDGLVWINQEKCTGCGLCVDGCPYGVIYFNKELNVAQKCTWCAHLVDKGETPRCADICPHNAIIFCDEGDPRTEVLKAKSAVYHPEYETRPRIFYKGLPKPFVAGEIIDSGSDELLKDVEITITDLFNDRSFTTVSDEFGDFWIRDLDRNHLYKIEFKRVHYEMHTAIVTADKDRNIGEIFLKKRNDGVA